jgi:hypothetical protein
MEWNNLKALAKYHVAWYKKGLQVLINLDE